MDINELLANPDIVITEEDLIAEGAIREMDAYGIATFRGAPVRTVSDTLFRALQDAFGLAASHGMQMNGQDWAETLAERAADGQTAPAIDDLDGRIDLVPPWATLGDLLQVLIKDAVDTAGPGEPQGCLYATPPVKALGDRPVWLQRPTAGEWTASFPTDN
jgi:hypothetical protein